MIFYVIIICFGIIGNTAIAYKFLDGVFKNPEASGKCLVTVLIVTGTSEIAVLFAIAQLALGRI